MSDPTVVNNVTISRPKRKAVEQAILERLLYVGDSGDGGIPPLRDDVPRFVLMGTPQQFLSALSG